MTPSLKEVDALEHEEGKNVKSKNELGQGIKRKRKAAS